jgi:ankyrin repeat protein
MYSMENKSLTSAITFGEENSQQPFASEVHEIVLWEPADCKNPNGTAAEMAAYIKQYETQIAPKTIEDYKVESLEALISMGAPMNTIDREFGRTPLYFAARKPKNLPLVQTLLVNRANPNLATRDGSTPLFAATLSPHNTQIISLLMQHGADPYRRTIIDDATKLEETALSLAKKVCIANYTAIVTALAERANAEEKTSASCVSTNASSW